MFHLSDSLVDQIIYAMENQKDSFCIHVQTGLIVREEDGGREMEFHEPIPGWKPSDGFQLMERFAHQLQNTEYRQQLESVLQKEHGVFRRFKLTCKAHEGLWQNWLRFKTENLKRIIRDWYDRLQSAIETEASRDMQLDGNYSLKDELALDFAVEVSKGQPVESSIQKGVYACFREIYGDMSKPFTDKKARMFLDIRRSVDYVSPVILVVKSPDGRNAGFLWADKMTIGGDACAFDLQLAFIEPLFRKMGLFRLLVEELLQISGDMNAEKVFVHIPQHRSYVMNMFKKAGFRQSGIIMGLPGNLQA